jgi:hypothetical protein
VTSLYQSLRKDSIALGEKRDCAVIATAVVTGVSYKEAHRALSANGRKDRDGTEMRITTRAIEDLGFHCTVLKGWQLATLHDGRKNFVHVTPPPGHRLHKAKTYLSAQRVLSRHFRGRKFLLRVNGHIAGFDGEQVQDWAAGRRHRIIEIIEVRSIK